jgi:hypothetical protein
MLNVVMLSVIMLSVIKLIVVMLSDIMLIVVMLIVVMLSVIMLSVMDPDQSLKTSINLKNIYLFLMSKKLWHNNFILGRKKLRSLAILCWNSSIQKQKWSGDFITLPLGHPLAKNIEVRISRTH